MIGVILTGHTGRAMVTMREITCRIACGAHGKTLMVNQGATLHGAPTTSLPTKTIASMGGRMMWMDGLAVTLPIPVVLLIPTTRPATYFRLRSRAATSSNLSMGMDGG